MWNKTSLPDAEVTVLLRLDCDDLPITTGYTDGAEWLGPDGEPVIAPVLGWMHLTEAASALDSTPSQRR